MKNQMPDLAGLDLSAVTKECQEFNEAEVLHRLRHYLPAQAPLKDFIHHNTLHAFQHDSFFNALNKASVVFGYDVTLSIKDFRELYNKKRIRKDVLYQVLRQRKGDQTDRWFDMLFKEDFNECAVPRIGSIRREWKQLYHIDLDAYVHPTLFRIVAAYLDQGISMWRFPADGKGLLQNLIQMERNSLSSFFKTKIVREILLKEEELTIPLLLTRLTGDENFFEHYLFDQQFAHAGWSGMVAVVEEKPETLLDTRIITIKEFIILELLLELDGLHFLIGNKWRALAHDVFPPSTPLFSPVEFREVDEVKRIWQEAFEWSYFDSVLAGLRLETRNFADAVPERSFQALFCIDDRECSLRRYVESGDPDCETFGTPGFFGVEFYYTPAEGKFFTKLCPAPVKPKHLIREQNSRGRHSNDLHFSKHSHALFRGWLVTNTVGLWSAFRLFLSVFRPSDSPATATSFRHMDQFSDLTIRFSGETQDGLRVGFTLAEMVQRVENQLRSIGLVKRFAPLVYVIGHGSSSVNNPHYSAYDCGACSGRPGSVNARVFCAMANDPDVRDALAERGIHIPNTTEFVGGLHDTTRDEIVFYDESRLSPANVERHSKNKLTFSGALSFNARERSRRFERVNMKGSLRKVHDSMRLRSVSLFEPRPELNHATNALCIVGRRELSRGLFLDRRSFLNSYDYREDPQGTYLLGILRAAAPVCGGINLEYFFSRVDTGRLGAGTKLPHNVVGLFGVANGIDGDLRTGLPTQMTEVHDPVRLMMIVEHFPDTVLEVIQLDSATCEWFANEWVLLAAVHPETRDVHVFKNGRFLPYEPLKKYIDVVTDLDSIIESDKSNLPVYLLNQI